MMPDPITKSPCESEIRLIEAIKQNPNSRDSYVDLAKFLEASGSLEESNIIYRGNLPPSVQMRHDLDPFPRKKTEQMEACSRLNWYGEEQIPLTAPTNEDPARNSIFQEPQITTGPEFVDLMQDGILSYDGRNRLYVDSAGTRNSEHSTMNSYLLMHRVKSVNRTHHADGLSIMLATRNSHNFYHWHFDCLAVLGMIEAAGIALTDIDNYLVDRRNQSFQLQMLLAAGISESQIRFIDVDDCTISFDHMLMVRLQNQQGLAQSRRHLDWLRSTYLKASCPPTSHKLSTPSRIAIKRDVRGFSNPDETYRILSDRGYECIRLEDFPYPEQSALFANASHVVAPHGAGLSLLVYCKPNTVVHEFYADHVQPCFWSLSSSLGLQYNNYNCSDIVDKKITSDNRNLSVRLAKSVNLTAEKLSSLTL